MIKEKAAYYARVSTEEEKQINALSKQCKDLSECIISNDWIEADTYIDEGKSGTQTKKRDEYNRLFEDLSENKWDILVIKSQDRLMRNVKDWYIFINELVTNGKKLFIYMDKSFYRPDNAMLLGIKAILAEEYSRDLSRKLNNAHKRRSKDGSSVMSNNKILGYYKQKGELVIDEKEAQTVRRIYEMYVNEKCGIREIINKLESEEIFTAQGKKFGETTINRVLQNEKYIGVMICGKQHKDFETKKVIKNNKKDWIIHENRIPSIISKDMFEKAQFIRESRRQIFNPDGVKRGKRSTQHPLGGKMYCGYCGNVMWYTSIKKTYKNSDVREYRYPWTCSTFARYGRIENGKFPNEGCIKKNINDAYLTEEIINFMKAFNSITEEGEMEDYINTIEKHIDNNEVDAKNTIKQLSHDIIKLESKQSTLLDRYLDNKIPDNVYKKKNDEIENEVLIIKEKIENLNNIEKNRKIQLSKLERIKEICKNVNKSETSYSEFCELISKIVVYNDKVEIYLYLTEDTCFVINKSLEFITNSFKKTHYKNMGTK